MVKPAFSTNAYTRYNPPEAIERIARAGYKGVEILADVPHAFFPSFEDSERQNVETTLQETGLSISNINVNTARDYYNNAPPSSFFDPTIITANDEDRTWRIGYTKAAIDFATAVDAPSVCIATGRPLPGNPPEQAREYMLESLADITNYAESAGVSVGIEFEPELLVECTDEVLTLIDDVGSDALGVNLDIGHVAVYREDAAESVRRCAGHITGVHLEDTIGGRRGKYYHQIPGEGDLDFDAIFGAMDDIGYDRYATLKLYTYTDTPDCAAEKAFSALDRYVQ